MEYNGNYHRRSDRVDPPGRHRYIERHEIEIQGIIDIAHGAVYVVIHIYRFEGIRESGKIPDASDRMKSPLKGPSKSWMNA